MKKIFVAIVFVAFSGTYANAQRVQSGIYLTERDFENNMLSYAGNTRAEINKIHFNEFFEKPFITVKHNGEKKQLFKDDIFAYQNKGTIVRTWNFVPYTFIERGVIWIYSKDQNVSQGKGIRREKKYFYSVSGKDEIIPLTINNLKRSFPEKHLFHDFLDAEFNSDADLAWYDSFEKKFKVNHLLETTIWVIMKK
ncbi:hypothetical protein A3860_34595 [Niastella vici]|uniref:Uncharacterized protein n=1 Tax=Niastella vici TaxID=1703345 RepID=A0A1V9FPF5_9BACT|nr:hypothetical protein [Niastella vici]OQP60208.1 hypothetical protein A3860_34595 [Niastella vici]